MNYSCNILMVMSLIILLAYITNYKGVVELFTSYYKNNINILSNTIGIYNTKVQNNILKNEHLVNTITEESLDYNNQHCNNYSLFYKLDMDNTIVDNKKTYVRALISNEKGVYSPVTEQCVHPFDPEFKDSVDCDKKIECNNGLLISGRPVTKDNKPSCVYDCIQHFSK